MIANLIRILEGIGKCVANNDPDLPKWINGFNINVKRDIEHIIAIGQEKFAEILSSIEKRVNSNPSKQEVDDCIRILLSLPKPGEEFARIVKVIIHPQMKAMGFKKKRNSFHKEVDGKNYKLAIYQSWTNNRDSINFIFKMTSPQGSEITISLPAKNRKNIKLQKWYNINPGTNIKELENEIRKDIKTHVRAFFTS